MLFANPNAIRETYPDRLKDIMNVEKANQSGAWLSQWSRLNPAGTPLHSLPDLAAELGVADILVKDESKRSELGSFKALGAPIALVRLILCEFPEQRFDAHGLLSGRYSSALADFTVISATDGNHGRALAAAAQSVGCGCVIVLHANVSIEREQAIATYGAEIIRISGNYDQSVEEAAALAQKNGWWVVSDTSYEGYEDIPRDVMQGYGTIAAEIIETGCAFTHVFLQGGVGGLAAGIASYLWELKGGQRPTFIVVEPDQADCLYQSAIAGKAAKTNGSVDSVMAGLACGDTSPLAWKFLQPSVDFFMTIQDSEAVSAMRRLAVGSEQDIPLEAGESAVAGLVGLVRIINSQTLCAEVGINTQSRILLISTEGATAPGVYAELVGETDASVRARQQAWLAKA
ncbi:diaminopropionate ammonia-lyase [Pseudomonas sp. RA_35y_Pfl2_P32]|uniref:diaminopropionate ammonia-lyase n=1 Tax=Pseudomonas sp. RA_35y_Pfl2_P32 TaxID=3088705 RepID=UPI0030DCFC36